MRSQRLSRGLEEFKIAQTGIGIDGSSKLSLLFGFQCAMGDYRVFFKSRFGKRSLDRA